MNRSVFLIVPVAALLATASAAQDAPSWFERLFGAGGSAAQDQVSPPATAAPEAQEAPVQPPAQPAQPPSAQIPAAPPTEVPGSAAQIQLSFAPIVRQVAPAVVNVYATQEMQPQASPLRGDPFFEQFFGRMPRSRPRSQSSLGSGVIVDPSGLVVTNQHVIANADSVRVALADGREFDAEIVLSDDTVDLAVLRIDSGGQLPVLPFGDSDELEVGDLVLAMGNPFGVGQTTTSGIISALARNHVGVSDFGFFIQTDAAINPGNSGGALIGMDGRLIGINTAIFSRSGGSNGIGFAIPANMVRAVVASAAGGSDHFERPFLGASFDPVTSDMAEALGMDYPRGVIISDVLADSPAERAGLEAGDVLLAMNGRAIEHPDALGYRLATTPIGSEARFDLLRGGQPVQVTVTLETAPDDSQFTTVLHGDHPLDGVSVTSLDSPLAQRLGIRSKGEGVLIVEMDRESAALRYGFAPGDIVRELNGVALSDPAMLQEVASERAMFWRVTIERNGRLMRRMFNL